MDTCPDISKCDFVRFTYSDLHGIARGKSVPGKLALKFIQDGIGVTAGVYCFIYILTSICIPVKLFYLLFLRIATNYFVYYV